MKSGMLAGALLLLSATGAAAEEKPLPAHATLPAGEAQRGVSVYQLDASFIDQDGKTVKLARFRGQPVIFSMFYGTCPYACPMLMSRIKRIEAALPEKERSQVKVVLVSLDPARDTPEAMKKLAKAHGLDEARWRLLRTEEEHVREVAAVLGIRYRSLKDGGMNHSSVITVLDRQGSIDTRLEGPDAELTGLINRLGTLASAKR